MARALAPDVVTVGLVTVARWVEVLVLEGCYLRVMLEGVDVTADCVYADDRRGYVVRFVRDAYGRVTLDPRTRRPVRVFTWGAVVIRRDPIDPRELEAWRDGWQADPKFTA